MDEWYIIRTEDDVREVEQNTNDRLGYSDKDEAIEDAHFYKILGGKEERIKGVTYRVEHRDECEPEIAIAKILMEVSDG